MTAVQNKSLLTSPVLPEAMDDAQFNRWAELLQQRTGIHLPEKRRSFLISSLNIRMRELGIDNYEDYFQYLITGRRGAVEWEILVDRLTVHETRFYRDEIALDLVREYTNHWLEQHTDTTERFELWSVGCATGEEPYSLAILLDDLFAQSDSKAYLGITATDVSTASLATGRKGIYPRNRLTNLPAELQSKYFATIDGQQHVQVVPELQQRVCFMRQNLLDLEWTRIGKMNIIFCQNVLIYFQREQRLSILNQLAEHLKPGGLLILGAGEITDWQHPALKSVNQGGTLAYRYVPTESEI